MTAPWQPYREPARATALRTVGLAFVVGTALVLGSRGRIAWPMAVLLVLWITLGGHFVELLYLNGLRPNLPTTRGVQLAVRLATWFIGGAILSLGMALSAHALAGMDRQLAWWKGGLAFVALELLVHFILYLRGRPNLYDGRA